MNKDIIGYVQTGFSAISMAKRGFNIFKYLKIVFSVFRGKKKVKTSKVKTKNTSNFIFGKKGRHIIKKDIFVIKRAFLIFKERFY